MHFDFSDFPTLKTERLILRKMTPADATAVLCHLGNPEVTEYLDTHPLKNIEQANAWLNWMGDFFAAKDGLRWGIVLKQGDESIIGSAGLHNWNRKACYAEIGYDIAKPYWGYGYATEVSQALIRFGWDRMDLNRLEADVVEGNEASMRVLQKLGFKQEGIWRERIYKNSRFYDVYQFGLLRREYIEDAG